MIQTKVSATGEDWLLLEPKDLRIGNALLYKDKFVHITMLSLDIDDEFEDTIGFCEWGKNNNEHCDWNRSMPELKPVPLTTEILEKCGFVTLDAETDLMEWGTNDGAFSILNDGGLDEERNKPYYYEDRNFKKTEIQYLHQLQNIYFALTGEELTINL